MNHVRTQNSKQFIAAKNKSIRLWRGR